MSLGRFVQLAASSDQLIDHPAPSGNNAGDPLVTRYEWTAGPPAWRRQAATKRSAISAGAAGTASAGRACSACSGQVLSM